MLQGVVFDNNTKSVNTTFSPNKNLLNDAQLQLKDSQWKKKNQLKVDKIMEAFNSHYLIL